MKSRTLWLDLVLGSLGFALVSVAAFSLWAFGGRWFSSEAALYAAIAAAFLIGSGVVLGPLAGGIVRFYRAFMPAFVAYAVLWCAAWFGLGGKVGEWVGAVLGGTAFVFISLALLGNRHSWWAAWLPFLAFHCAGYFAGDWAYGYAKAHAADLSHTLSWTAASVRAGGRLAWGVMYGLGFGAGIGFVFHRGRVGT
jgi:hypothetical protein